jgi:ssDNA-binding Zn-finger/Zn-ribbon topoisomerase 1
MLKITTSLLQDEDVLVRLNMTVPGWTTRIELALTTQRIIWKEWPFGKTEKTINYSDIVEVKDSFAFIDTLYGSRCLTVFIKGGKKQKFAFSQMSEVQSGYTPGLAKGLFNLIKKLVVKGNAPVGVQPTEAEKNRYDLFMGSDYVKDVSGYKEYDVQRDRFIEVLNIQLQRLGILRPDYKGKGACPKCGAPGAWKETFNNWILAYWQSSKTKQTVVYDRSARDMTEAMFGTGDRRVEHETSTSYKNYYVHFEDYACAKCGHQEHKESMKKQSSEDRHAVDKTVLERRAAFGSVNDQAMLKRLERYLEYFRNDSWSSSIPSTLD